MSKGPPPNIHGSSMEASVTVPPGPRPSYVRAEETQRRQRHCKRSLEDSPLLGALRWRPRPLARSGPSYAAKAAIAINMQKA